MFFSLWLIVLTANKYSKTHPTELATCTSFELIVHNCNQRPVRFPFMSKFT